MDDLKSCPFCGGGAHIREIRSCDMVLYSVSCDRVGCYGFELTACFPSPEEAAEEWNRRAERTCRPVVADDGAGAWGVYCSECGYRFAGPHGKREVPEHMATRRDIMPRYCPSCGARVVE